MVERDRVSNPSVVGEGTGDDQDTDEEGFEGLGDPESGVSVEDKGDEKDATEGGRLAAIEGFDIRRENSGHKNLATA